MATSMDEYITELHQTGQGQANQLYTPRTESDQQLIDQVNAAIDRATQAATKPYQTQMEQLPDAYRKIYDTNAVQELVGRRQLQETMANMGLTDSGLNRTQQTALSLQRGNADADARLEQQKKTQELQDRIAQLLESGAAQKQQQEATVRNNTSNWYNALQTDMYNNAVEQGTNLYNQALAREEQARQLELERQNALAVAQEEAKKAQAEAAAQAKQQAFDNQLSVISAMEKAGASSDSIMAYMQSIGLLPKETVSLGSNSNDQTNTNSPALESEVSSTQTPSSSGQTNIGGQLTSHGLSATENSAFANNLKADMSRGLNERDALNAIVDHVYAALGLDPRQENAISLLPNIGRLALEDLIQKTGLEEAAWRYGQKKVDFSAYY